MNTQFETVIGLEVHAQLLTESKAFAPVSNRFGSAPNTNITPLCLGHPGTLPVPNENLIRYAVRLGLATNCKIARKSIFARKNYFYPDMPKGYQISQFETPICYDGYLDIEVEDDSGATEEAGASGNHNEADELGAAGASGKQDDSGAPDEAGAPGAAGEPAKSATSSKSAKSGTTATSATSAPRTKRIGLTRIHMEEDAGKSIHDQDPHNTLIDLNRAGTPLLEIVSEPDIRSPQQAGAYMRKIWQLVRYLGVSDGNMEEGSLRCDANVSIRVAGDEEFQTRTEIKNLNSFRNVERALTYEVERQKEVVGSGGQVIQQTLLWDPDEMKTRQMRTKEEAHDYRYFPEPDIPPIIVTDEMLDEIRMEIPELPEERRRRYINEFNLSDFDASVLTEDRPLADYFEEVLEHDVKAKPAANLIITEVRRIMNVREIPITEFPVDPQRLAGLIAIREEDKISSSAMQTLLDAMLDSDKDAETLAGEKNLLQVSDTGFLEPMVDQVLNDNPNEVKRYLDGKKGLIGFFVGQIMKQSKGKANPEMVRELIQNKIKEHE